MSDAAALEVDALLAGARLRKKKKEAEEAEKKKKEEAGAADRKAAEDAKKKAADEAAAAKSASDAAAKAKADEAAAAAKAKAADDAAAAKRAAEEADSAKKRAAEEADASKKREADKAKRDADNKAAKELVSAITTTDFYWLSHPEHAWVPGKRTKDTGTALQFVTEEGLTIEKPYSELRGLEKASAASINDDVPNLVNLDVFGEAAVLHKLRARYQTDSIYTNIGTILISVNPYKVLPIYISSVVDDYKRSAASNAPPGSLPPHVFTIAADAYKGLLEEGKPQAVIISGESGAGKTEATKMILQYLSDVAQSESGVEQEILQSNPILESFGNAKTVRNNNSSRFGKWQEIKFLNNGRVYAARIVNYLLEKSRVTTVAKNERNYHIFYQLCAGVSSELKKTLSLDAPEKFEYLKQSGCYSIDGVVDKEDFSNTGAALSRLGFGEAEVTAIWTILAGLLHLGNVKLDSDGKEGSKIANPATAAIVSSLLKLDAKLLESALTSRSISVEARGSVTKIPLKADEASESRNALAKAIYGKLFDWLIKRVNASLNKTQGPGLTIGILDIFGFESFENNSFEQFCINYANEKLQQHFQLHLFKYEQEEYKAEGINNAYVEFTDNRECLELIERKPVGLLAILDEEVVVPKGTDATLIAKFHSNFADKEKHKCYATDKKSANSFVIKHYAGDVTYEIKSFLVKNKDKLHETLYLVAERSELKLLAELWRDEPAAGADAKSAPAPSGSPKGSPKGSPRGGRPGSGGKRPASTLGGQFQNQLTDLMAILHAADPHYIRCIKPNALKKPNVFSSALVLQQMKYAGLFEAIKIRKNGYPCRRTHEAFAKRFRILIGAKAKEIKEFTAAKPVYRDQCLALLKVLSDRKEDRIDSRDLIMGKTKVFYRNNTRLVLQTLRDKSLEVVAVRVQKRYNLYRLRKRYKTLLAVYRECQAAVKTRTAVAIEAAMTSLDKNNAIGELFIEKELKKIMKYLKEEDRVCKLLESAVSNKAVKIEQLSGAIEEAGRLAKNNPKEPVSARLTTFIKEATKQKEKLAAMQDARVKIKNAVVEEELKLLQSALKDAKAAGLPAAELKDAEELCARLVKEDGLVQTLKKLVEKDDDQSTDAVEKALKAVEQLAAGDSARAEVVEAAHKWLVDKFGVVLDDTTRAGGTEAENKIRDQLIPKWEHFGEWAESLVTRANDWIHEEEKRRAAEAERLEKEKHDAERKKAADEKKKKDEAEKKKRDEEAKKKREKEEAERKKKADEERAKRASEETAEREKREAEEAKAEEERLAKEAAEEADRRRKEEEEEKARAKADEEAAAKRKKEADAKRAADEKKRAAEKDAAEKKRKEAIEKKKAEEEEQRWKEETDRAALKTRAMSILPGSKLDDDEEAPPPPSTKKPLPKPVPHKREPSNVPPPPPPSDDSEPPAPVKKLGASKAQDAKTAASAGAAPSAAAAGARNALMRKSIFFSNNATRMQEAIALVNAEDAKGMEAADVKRMDDCGKAIKARDLTKLSAAISELETVDSDSKILRVAKTLEKQLQQEKKVMDRVRLALEEMDEGELQKVLQLAQDVGLDQDMPELAKARQFAYGMSRNDFLLARISAAIAKDQVEKVKLLSEQAAKLGLPQIEAKQYLHAEANKALTGATQKYAPFLSLKGQFQFEHFPLLRREGNYAKGNYFKKSYYKKMRLLFQKDDIPRSLFKLSIAYCGGVEKSKALKKQAVSLFKSIRGYMGDVSHSYPTTLAAEIIDLGRKEALMRDEIYCQLMKQTSQNPNADSLIKGWRLMFLCLSNFPISKEMSSFLLSHMAATAHVELPAELGFNKLQDLCSNCYFAHEQTTLLGTKLPPGLTTDGVSEVTKGIYPAIKVADLSLKLSGGKTAAAGTKDSKDAKSKK